jgi:hypothetical protein
VPIERQRDEVERRLRPPDPLEHPNEEWGSCEWQEHLARQAGRAGTRLDDDERLHAFTALFQGLSAGGWGVASRT